jgi:hypothetical protein
MSDENLEAQTDAQTELETTTEPVVESATEETAPQTTSATVHEAADHIASVLSLGYAAAEYQARQMTDAERIKCVNLKTGNDIQSHFFEVSQRIAKESQPETQKAVVDSLETVETVEAVETVETVEAEPSEPPQVEPAEPVEAEETKPEPKPKKRK